MERKTSVINEEPFSTHYLHSHFSGTENVQIRTDDAVCAANRGCFSQAELFFMELAMRTKVIN